MDAKPLPPFTIETERLLLRAPDANDSAQLHEAITESIEELRRWWDQVLLTEAEAEEQSYRLRVMFYNRKAFTWRIYTRDDQRLIGSIDVHSWDWEVPRAEIGYWLRNSVVGHGYMTEALIKVVELMLDQVGVRRLEVRCDTRNLSAIAVAQRSGFHPEGVVRFLERDTSGHLCDILLLSTVRPDTSSDEPG